MHLETASNKLNNQSLKEERYNLKRKGRSAPTSPDDKIVKGIDGIYVNEDPNSNIKKTKKGG